MRVLVHRRVVEMGNAHAVLKGAVPRPPRRGAPRGRCSSSAHKTPTAAVVAGREAGALTVRFVGAGAHW